MNTLIKLIITAVIGFFGSLTEVNDSEVNAEVYYLEGTKIESYQMNGTGFCRFNEKSCIKLKNEIPS